jgi:hypothetical protein
MNSEYTIMTISAVRDSSLSLRARGLLACLLSYPEPRTTSAAAIAGETTEGIRAVRSATRELAAVGYVHRVVSSKGHGLIAHEMHLFSEPVTWCEIDGCRDCKARKEADHR